MQSRPAGGIGSNQYQTRGASSAVARHGGQQHLISALTDDSELDDSEPDAVDPLLTPAVIAGRVANAVGKVKDYLPGNRQHRRLTDENQEMLLATAVHIARMVRDAGIDIDGQDPEGPEAIGWAFANPDWASAGFGINDEVETRLYRKPEDAAEARAKGLAWWDDPGMTPEWWEKGWISTWEVHQWKEGGFTPDTATAWNVAGFDAAAAVSWRDRGFTVETAGVWRTAVIASGKGDQTEDQMAGSALTWRERGIPPDEMEGWVKAGFNASQAQKRRNAGQSYTDESNLGPAGIPGNTWKTLTKTVTTGGYTADDPVRFQYRQDQFQMTIRDGQGREVAHARFDRNGKFLEAIRADEAGGRKATRRVSPVTTMKELPGRLADWARGRY